MENPTRAHRRKKPADEMLRLRIKVAMLERGWGVTDLATRVGVTHGAVSQWLNGTSEPTRANQQGLASAFGISVAKLTGEGLTPEQVAAEKRYLERVIRGGERVAKLLEQFSDEELIRHLEPHLPKPEDEGSGS